MEIDLILPLLARWAHILAAVTLVGGILFIRLVLLPSYDALTAEQKAAMRSVVIGRWKKVVMVCIALLLLSGAYNFFKVSLPKAEVAPIYHSLFGVKFLVAMAVFFISSALVGRAPVFERMRTDSNKWFYINGVLALAVILISGALSRLG